MPVFKKSSSKLRRVNGETQTTAFVAFCETSFKSNTNSQRASIMASHCNLNYAKVAATLSEAYKSQAQAHYSGVGTSLASEKNAGWPCANPDAEIKN